MKVFDGYGDAYSSTEYIKDRTQPGEPDALSVIDEDALRTVASQLGVEYVHREAGTGVEAVVADARDGAVASDEGRAEAVVDLYWIAAVPLFLLALVEAAVVARALAEIRVRPRADRAPGRTSS
jgi:Ca-activated chloride channel family protein